MCFFKVVQVSKDIKIHKKFSISNTLMTKFQNFKFRKNLVLNSKMNIAIYKFFVKIIK